MKVGDLIKCVDGGIYIVSAITEECLFGAASYADLVDAATLETGAAIRIDDNPHYEIVSSRDHS